MAPTAQPSSRLSSDRPGPVRASTSMGGVLVAVLLLIAVAGCGSGTQETAEELSWTACGDDEN